MAEVKANSGLMKKTKKELVEIILRKDDVEKDLSTKLKSATDSIEALKNNYSGLSKQLNQVKAELFDAENAIKERDESIVNAITTVKQSEDTIKQLNFTIEEQSNLINKLNSRIEALIYGIDVQADKYTILREKAKDIVTYFKLYVLASIVVGLVWYALS